MSNLFHNIKYMYHVGNYYLHLINMQNPRHAPCKSFSFHSIAAGHLTNLNYLKVNYLVSVWSIMV